jgi:AcrR family transcriptional regulator
MTASQVESRTDGNSTRERILRAAADLLAASGGEPVSTRAVCAAAGIGAPTLYHYFGDKEGLFDAVVAYGFERYLAEKRALPVTGDSIGDLRRGWDAHVGFARSQPTFYLLMFGAIKSGHRPAAADEGYQILLAGMREAARAGLLRVPPETATDMAFSASVGVALTVIAEPDKATGGLSDRVREAVLAAVTTGSPATPPSPLTAHAIALDASLDQRPAGRLTDTEAALLREWLGRLAAD